MENNNEDIYNTTIYTDYVDLPKEKQDSLFREWLAGDAEQRKFFFFYKFSSLFLLIPAISITVALIYFFINGISPAVLVFTISAFILLALFAVLSFFLDRERFKRLSAFAEWLKVEKRVLATFKKKSDKKQ